jgi:archaemetzincin
MIELVPIGDVDPSLISDICLGIKNVFPPCKQADEILPIHIAAYNPSRGQYDSMFFLNALMEYARDKNLTKVLGITPVDIYTEDMNFIFGHAFLGGRVCLISLRRLDPNFYGEPQNYRLFLDRCIKEAVHELGHSYGLGHCEDWKCVMVFSNSILDVDKKSKQFCEKCRSLLREKGLP